MIFDCEFAVKKFIPAFRSILANQLVNEYGLTQVQVAHKLGLTQAAISNYLNSKRAVKCRIMLGDDFSIFYSFACKTAEKIVAEKTPIVKITKDFCKLCMDLKEKYSKKI